MAHTTPTEKSRPDPEALLAEVEKGTRGKLKIFLGAAPGVGKTYAMLEEARVLKAENIDVVVGIVETHGRRETQRLLVGLDMIPRKLVTYRGRTFSEMDLDQILERRPKIALIDELAHTNVPGTRHTKRWQDIEELLEAGIDVHTTVNIQHLESVNDIVERISGIKVRETIPDHVLERANEIEVVDLTPEDLIKRLREGKVYVPDQAERAIQRFFSRGNLTALREMALRAAAERIDKDVIDYLRTHAVGGTWPTRERLLVCVGAGGDAENLVRTGKRLADRNRAPWIVLHVVRPHTSATDREEIVDRALLLAEQLGAETETLTASGSIADAILGFARNRNVTRIVTGRRTQHWQAWLTGDLQSQLIARSGGFEITIAGSEVSQRRTRPQIRWRLSPPGRLDTRAYLIAVGLVALAVPAAMAAHALLPEANTSLILLAAVLAAAMQGVVGAAILSSILAFLCYNYFFTLPYYSFRVYFQSDTVTVTFFFIFSLVVGTLAARLKQQMDATQLAATRTRNLYEFTRRALSATTDYDMAWAIVSHAATSMRAETLLLRPTAAGGFEITTGFPPVDTLDTRSRAAAEWALKSGKRAGWQTETLPDSKWLFMPLATQQDVIGLLGISREDRGRGLTEPERRLLETLCDQSAVILERGKMIAETAEAHRFTETEKLRTALLSSVSHDFRTPLVSVIGAASTLRDLGDKLSESARTALLDTIVSESARLNRFIQNLLDMTKLGYGAIAQRREWLDVPDIVEAAQKRLGGRLRRHELVVSVAPEAALVMADATLLEQVLVNLLDNAVKYSPEGSRIEVAAKMDRGHLSLTVADAGPGIAAEKKEKIFDLFYRVQGQDRQKAGTGLGLTIVRGFVEAMGGTVSVSNRMPGPGTMFEIRLPRPDEPPPRMKG